VCAVAERADVVVVGGGVGGLAVAVRLAAAGRRVVLLDISKARGDEFLERIGELLTERGAVVTRRLAKPTFSRPAPVELIEEAAGHADLVVEGLAD